tara:strand:- start:3672 stop:4349 length:678 start_codon:yes stop_codon:yes gene_type:complete
MKQNLLVLLISICIIFPISVKIESEFNITRLKYSGGGDWYGDPSSLPNLLKYIRNNTKIKTAENEIKAKIGDSKFFDNSYYYLTGHGDVRFTKDEQRKLREALLKGGFLHVDDNYGLDKSFREEIKKIFPEKELVELPKNHKIFNIYYKLSNGLPKIHEHDGNPAQALALFDDGKIILLYTYESDLGDGWEDINVHNVPFTKHQSALKMGTNIVINYLTQQYYDK